MEFHFPDPIQVKQPSGYIPFPWSSMERSIGECFEDVVSQFPNNKAVVHDGQEISYKLLDIQANKIAHAILETHLHDDAPILILLGRDAEAVYTILGILKAGKMYLALEPNLPVDYLKQIVNDSKPGLIITNSSFFTLATQLANQAISIINLDENILKYPETKPDVKPQPASLAAIYYTSGSTGTPKGVVLDHRALIHRSWIYINRYCLSPQDKSTQPAPFGFSWSIGSLFGTLLTGGTLYPCNYGEMKLPGLFDWLEKNGITIFQISLGLLRQLFISLPKETRKLQKIRLVITGGDDLFIQDFKFWKLIFPSECLLGYTLSSTEAGNITSKFFDTYRIPGSNRLPTGYPVSSVNIRIQNSEGAEVGVNEIGEIAVQSPSLLRGYWVKNGLIGLSIGSLEKKTPPGFFLTGDLGRILPDGSLEFMGRLDNMLKIRGYSVDPKQIKSLLVEHPAISDVLIIAKSKSEGQEQKRLIAYIVLKAKQTPRENELRKFLAAHIPLYMLPSRFVYIDHFPYNSNGKVDVQSLPEPPERGIGQIISPRTDQEKVVAKIWSDLLGVESISIDDNFFELGGDSLLALNMAFEIEKQTGFSIPEDFFQLPTVAHLVDMMGEGINKREEKACSPKINNKFISRVRFAFRKIFVVLGRFQLRTLFTKTYWMDIFLSVVLIPIRIFIQTKTYTQGNKWLLEWCRKPKLKTGIFQIKYRMFQDLLASSEKGIENTDKKFELFMVANILKILIEHKYWKQLGKQFLEKCHDSRFPYWKSLGELIEKTPLEVLNTHISFSGLENVFDASMSSNGVILVSYHGSLNRLAGYALSRHLDRKKITTISQKVAEGQSWYLSESKIPREVRGRLHAGVAYKGQLQLGQGKIIQLFSDRDFGSDPSNFPAVVAGRAYFLKTGLAELAVNTGAQIIPFFSTIQSDGRIHTTFLEAFKPTSGDRALQIKNYMQQYARFLTSCWEEAPESFPWVRVKNHLRQPKLPPDDLSGI